MRATVAVVRARRLKRQTCTTCVPAGVGGAPVADGPPLSSGGIVPSAEPRIPSRRSVIAEGGAPVVAWPRPTFSYGRPIATLPAIVSEQRPSGASATATARDRRTSVDEHTRDTKTTEPWLTVHTLSSRGCSP
jgi:hypothetical protein